MPAGKEDFSVLVKIGVIGEGQAKQLKALAKEVESAQKVINKANSEHDANLKKINTSLQQRAKIEDSLNKAVKTNF